MIEDHSGAGGPVWAASWKEHPLSISYQTRTTMKISDLEFCLVEIECSARQRPVRSLLVRLASDSGLEGWGEARVAWRAAELAARRDALLPVLSGRSIFDIEELLELEVLGERAVRCALEMASWDLVGRTVGEPLCHLFGGAYRQRIPLAVRLVGDSADGVAQLARELAEQGFHSQIITSCGRPEADCQTVAAVRQSVPGRTELRLDATTGYEMETARDLCTELEPHGLQFLLDPLDTQELYAVASLGRQTSVPLAVWRAIHSPADVLALVRSGAAQSVVVDLRQVGGLVPARKCAAVAEAGGTSAFLAGGPWLGPGTAAMLHLAASTPVLSNCNECAYHQLQDDLLSEPLEIIDGMIPVPQAPGLGVQIDRAKVERYQVT